MEVPEIIVFNGVEYRLMGGKRRYYLSQSSTNEGRRHAKGLHVAVWEFYSGQTVPPGCDIHHKDGNPFNNEYSNLECVPRSKHHSEHSAKNPYNGSEAQREHLDSVRELAAQWHRSPEGREWHKGHYPESLGKIQPRECTCRMCGKPFTARNAKAYYCSHNCEVKYSYRAHKREVDRVCAFCGKPFKAVVTDGSDGAQTCSRKCRAGYRAQQYYAETGKNPPGTVLRKTCPCCGAEFETTTSHAKPEGSRTCSRRCSALLRERAKRGETE